MVVMIIAIAAAIVVPALSGTSDFQAIGAARLVASDLQYAQNTAITSQKSVTVAFDIGAESYKLSYASEDLIHPISKSTYLIDFSSRGGFEKLDVVSADFGGKASVTFDVLGAPDDAGTVTLKAGPHIYRVTVAAATGRISVDRIGS